MRFLSLAFAAVALLASTSLAQDTATGPDFVEPSGGFGGTIGGNCNIEWKRDTTGNWTNARIDLMTGSDIFRRALVIVHDNFDASKDTTFQYKCPDVDTGSTIYMYRMVRLNSRGGEADRKYTARFCISNGNCATPAHAEQPTGGGDPWGRGYLSGSALSRQHNPTN